jgi:hypothetical protein
VVRLPACRLESCFKEIPTCSRDPDPPPLLHQDESQEQVGSRGCLQPPMRWPKRVLTCLFQ